MSFKRLVPLLALIAIAVPVAASAGEHCSNATLNGSYGLHAAGIVIGVGNFAAVGRFTYDGGGNLSGTLFIRLNGNNVSTNLKGRYSVNPDCTFSDVWMLPDGSSSTHLSVLVNEGKEYSILNTTAGEPSVISGVAKRQ